MLAGCVAHQYSARSYRNVNTSVVYATICHGGKRTLRIPAEEWPEHKAHFDYRGPCRARGVPTAKPKPKAQHTATAYSGRKALRAKSERDFAEQRQSQVPTAEPTAPD